MSKMIYLLFILLCGVRSHFIPQPTSRSFLKEYEQITKTLPIQKFDILTNYTTEKCDKKIPLKIPKFTYSNIDSIQLHVCMAILESIDRLSNDYKNKLYKESLDTFFNRPSTAIMEDLRSYSNDICSNFSTIVQVNKAQWTENLRHKFSQSEKCTEFCKADEVITNQCIFIYGIHKVIYLFESKSKLPTTQKTVSTISNKDPKIALPSFNTNAPQNEKSPVKNSELPAENQELLVKNRESIGESSAIITKTIVESVQNNEVPPKVADHPNRSNFDKIVSIDSQDGGDDVEDTERFQTPISTSTTLKNVVKEPSSTTNKKPTQTQEVIIPSSVVHKPEVDHVEDVKPKQQEPPPPPPPQIQDSDTEYEGNVDGDNKDDEDIDKDDDIVVPKNDQKNIRIDEEFSKRISSYGKKTIAAQEVDTEVSLMPWYLMVVFCAFLVYLSFANKKKIVAYVVEGRPNGRYGRRGGRPNTANYRKLDSNLEEAITSNCSTATSHVIY